MHQLWSVIVFDCYDVCLDVCPMILATIVGEVLPFAMGVHICVHNYPLDTSVVKSLQYVETFKTSYVLD